MTLAPRSDIPPCLSPRSPSFSPALLLPYPLSSWPHLGHPPLLACAPWRQRPNGRSASVAPGVRGVRRRPLP